jgi:hypothetical protein
MKELHCFQFDGKFRRETVIAHDIKDAWLVVKEEGTECHPKERGNFVQLDGAQLFKLELKGEPIENGFPSNDGWTKKAVKWSSVDHTREGWSYVWCSERTCTEWVQLAGRGQLAGPMVFW